MTAFGENCALTELVLRPVSFPSGRHPLECELNCRILQLARETDHRVYLVGGYIRDALLPESNFKSKDLDYTVVRGSALNFAKAVAQRFAGHYVPLDVNNDTARVVLDNGNVADFAGCVGGQISTDVLRRDFTINALVWDPETPQSILDYVDGLQDLVSRTIRSTGESSLTDDPLRVLRAFRFAAMLDGEIEPQTLNWLRSHANKLPSVAAERINHELFTLLAKPNTAKHVENMADVGVLEAVFPELAETRSVPPNAFHHLGLFEHSIETVPQLEIKLAQCPQWLCQEVETHLSSNVTRLSATKVACLLHDIGKPQTWIVTPEGRHTFYGHDKLGAQMCEVVATRMKWSRNVERFITKLVRWHLRPGQLFHQGRPTERAVRRFYNSVGEEVPELMLLAFADFGATRGPGLMGENRISLENDLNDLLDGFKGYLEESRSRIKLLNGDQIMKILNIESGPIIGEILVALQEAQEFNEVRNASEAEHFVIEHYQRKYSK